MKEVRPNKSHLLGLAGVHAVASQLALRGHNPCMPGVDYGFDIILDTGIRIQVKTSGLFMTHPAYPEGVYRFSIKENKTIRQGKIIRQFNAQRDWKNICDYFIFWGVDDNRFFIVPCREFHGNGYVRRGITARSEMKERAKEMKAKRIPFGYIASTLGLSIAGLRKLLSTTRKLEKFLGFEGAWDQLDVEKVLSQVSNPELLNVPAIGLKG